MIVRRAFLWSLKFNEFNSKCAQCSILVRTYSLAILLLPSYAIWMSRRLHLGTWYRNARGCELNLSNTFHSSVIGPDLGILKFSMRVVGELSGCCVLQDSIYWGLLNYFMPLVSLYTPREHEKTSGFPVFSGGIKRDYWHEMSYLSLLAFYHRKKLLDILTFQSMSFR